MKKICVFIPVSHKEIVKKAMFNAGAGRLGNYASCSFETLGKGQFMPLEGSSPYIGNKDKVEIVEEYKVEMLCHDDDIRNVIKALKESHPYEEPAYDIIQLVNDEF
jgi:hypothetical protein